MKRTAAGLILIGTLLIQATPVAAPTKAYAGEPKLTPQIPLAIMQKWDRVAWCESHAAWTQVYPGPHSFSGALGIRNDVWLEHGGGRFGATAGNASPEEQVIIAREIQRRGGVPEYVPDQDGACHGW
jgi:hypothetical protein